VRFDCTGTGSGDSLCWLDCASSSCPDALVAGLDLGSKTIVRSSSSTSSGAMLTFDGASIFKRGTSAESLPLPFPGDVGVVDAFVAPVAAFCSAICRATTDGARLLEPSMTDESR
jgi:hypothetical protein